MTKFIIWSKNFIKNSPFGNIIRILARPYFIFTYKTTSFTAWLREKRIIKSKKYAWIKELKDSHKGERCFIVATGPSLTFEDLNLIKTEYSFGMNSCVLALDKTEWTPNIIGIQDEFVYNKIEKTLLKEAQQKLKNKIIVSNLLAEICPSARKFKQFPLHNLDHRYDRKKTREIKFSDDCYKIIYDGYSIVFSILQLAVYMGFKKIYLLGCDCNYNQKKKNFIDHGAIDPYASIMGNRLIYVHSLFYKFAQAHNIQVFNCTRGGMLEIYPRMRLEDVINNY